MRLFDRGLGHWDLRASDEDRERVVELLREHCAAGRLHLEEFTARLDEVYAARTYRELAWTIRELPRLEPRPASADLGIRRHLMANGVVTAAWLALANPFDAYGGGLDVPLPLVTMLGSAAIIGARAWRQWRQAAQLGGRRQRYEVAARDRWHPGMQPPPRWLPSLGWRQLPRGRGSAAQPPPQPRQAQGWHGSAPRPWPQPRYGPRPPQPPGPRPVR